MKNSFLIHFIFFRILPKNKIRIYLIVLSFFSFIIGGCNTNTLQGYSAIDLTPSPLVPLDPTTVIETAVAVIDTGIARHENLDESLLLFKDFINHNPEPYDDNGHGTEVSGIISGNGIGVAKKYSGVVPGQKLIVLKAFDNDGNGDLFALSDSIDWIIENKQAYKIKLVCMSFGFDVSPIFNNSVMENLIERLHQNGIIIITSAGNNGEENGEITIPGTYSGVLTVGSLNYQPLIDKNISSAEISDFSSTKINGVSSSIKPELYAPGEQIITTSAEQKNAYTVVSGTSYSAALVCGQIAWIMNHYPHLTSEEIIDFVIKNRENRILDIPVE
ncbi:S8 family serine peptidase [Paenibacillus algorifonticola]|uniref:S8 family serine peptidase n=1 Tax=Paenibacillus algorifonticola TaxID=684063 RepID=UPI003D2D6983